MKALKYLVIFISLFIFSLYAQDKVNQIDVPPGYKRLSYPKDSYSEYIQKLPLKQNNTIYKWDGSRIWLSLFLYNILVVVNKPILYEENIEQCADYSMRFWADYHKDVNILNRLYLYDYNGNKKFFKNSNKSYLKYLRWHMAYSNSYSIKNGAKKIDSLNSLIPGDMFVQNTSGAIGHVSVIVDVAENEKKESIYLVGYSYMPAQEFHIEDAENQCNAGVWFTKDGYIKYLLDSRLKKFGEPVIRRF